MFDITLITMGKLKEKFYISAAEEYKKRLGGYCKLTLLELVREARRDGYSGNLGENESRVCSLCVPVYGMDGTMVAGISVCGLPEDVMPGGEFRQDLMQRIRAASSEISRQLGYSRF